MYICRISISWQLYEKKIDRDLTGTMETWTDDEDENYSRHLERIVTCSCRTRRLDQDRDVWTTVKF